MSRTPPFIIAIWYPPAASMQVWKARGINTVIGYEHQSNQVSLNEWSEAAASEGLFMIRTPRPNLAEDLNEPYLLAWMHIDEPDLKKIDPPGLIDEYAEWKKTAPQMPVFLSVSGGGVLFHKLPRAMYEHYFESADWIANDFYPITGWNQPTWIPRLGQAVDICRKLSGGKPQFAFIETSSQRLAWNPPSTRGVNPAEIRAEIWHAVIHGVKGVIYFPQQFNPFVYDATPSDVSIELAAQNRMLTQLGAILALPPNPKSISVTVGSPLEAAWRQESDGTVHVLVLNLSNQQAKNAGFEIVNAQDRSVHFNTEANDSLIHSQNDLTSDFAPYEFRHFIVKLVRSTP